MKSSDQISTELTEAVEDGNRGLEAANRLCHACVDLLDVDGAAISIVHEGSNQGTFGSDSALSRRLDEYQFTFGEGPCLDAVSGGQPVLVQNLQAPSENRWPAYAGAVIEEGILGVFALPIGVTSLHVGALDLFRFRPGSFTPADLEGGLAAASLAALPVLDLMTAEVDWDSVGQGEVWTELTTLERVEVYQATGMIMGQLDVNAAEALVRLRAHAYRNGMTASEVAWAIVERRLSLGADDTWRDRGSTERPL